MTYEEVSTLVESIGYPSAYYQFEEDTAKKPPFVVFYFPQRDDMFADNSNYTHIEQLIIELYTPEKDWDAEAAVEAVLESNEITYEKEETYIESEQLYMAVYQAEVLISPADPEGG